MDKKVFLNLSECYAMVKTKERKTSWLFALLLIVNTMLILDNSVVHGTTFSSNSYHINSGVQ